ncbi:DUF5073 family protein [Mycobacterium sp.]|uniref:DUF5073 family protein n=1 Tax=Mycobacterium sp. TaxID=1785 RepID=UPI002BB1E5FC|nr:DUF5073 family protein [Mycobacterium sp.]HKP40696.1 DUF5073 family protein [Mycobacterium sp.]
MTGFDPDRVSRTVAAALSGPGGVGLVVKVFAGLPGVVHTPAQRGLFRSQPERVHIGDWRYEVTRDGRLHAGHFVNGIVIAEETLPAAAVGPHIARALGQIVDRYGANVLPQIDAAVDALQTSSGY